MGDSCRPRFDSLHFASSSYSLYTSTKLPNTRMADPKFLKYVDEHQDELIDRLAAAVAIPSWVLIRPSIEWS